MFAAVTAACGLVTACGGHSNPSSGLIFWAHSPHGGDDEHGSIGRVNPDGRSAKDSFVPGARSPGGVATHGQYVYWANYASGTIGRAETDGSKVDQRFVTTGDEYSIVGLAVDHSHIYWADSYDGTIGRANIGGSHNDRRFIRVSGYVIAVAVDRAHIYWTQRDSLQPKTGCCAVFAYAIGRANLDGSHVDQRFIKLSNAVDGVAVNSRYVFWSSVGEHAIGRANLDGTSVFQRCIALKTLPLENVPEGLAVDGNYVYWTNYPTDSIARGQLDGSNVDEHFVDVKGVPEGIAVAGGTAASAAAPCPATRPQLILGPVDQVAGPYAEGWGEVAPAVISNGGAAASGTISDIHWSSWGGRVAIGRGLHPEYAPQGGYYPKPLVMELRASAVGRCKPGGRLVYTRFSFREQLKPGGPIARRWSDWAGNMCRAFR